MSLVVSLGAVDSGSKVVVAVIGAFGHYFFGPLAGGGSGRRGGMPFVGSGNGGRCGSGKGP
jgi:hypothetical protein